MRGSPRKPVLLLACYFPRSVELEGVGAFVMGLADGMAARGWEVRLLLPAGEYRPMEGVQMIMYGPQGAGLLRYHSRLRDNSSRADAVLLVENNPNMGFLAKDSRRSNGTFAYFCTPFQDLRAIWGMGLSGQALRHIASKSPLWSRCWRWRDVRCIVATEFQAAQLRRFRPARVSVLPGCGLSRGRAIPSRQAARRRLGWDDRPVVGYLGHYSRAKGVGLLLEAFDRSDIPAVLALAGSGKGRLSGRGMDALERLRRRGALRELDVTDATAFLAACDVVALPYVTTSIFHLPQVLLESFAASTAVVVSDVGGLGEAVAPGETGELVAPRDAAALAGGIASLLADLPSARQMGRNARRRFEQRFCREVFLEGLCRLFEGGAA